jgi:dTDP-4-amino-4,6-dideoxygalactose transaminase
LVISPRPGTAPVRNLFQRQVLKGADRLTEEFPMAPRIPFNKPFIAGKELYYIAQAVTYGNLAGDGHFTQACRRVLEDRFGIAQVMLVPSCTAALEMAALLFDLKPGDEVIMPSYTFVSTANAVARLGARPVFVDIRPDTLNLDDALVEEAITERTRAIFPVHYAGVGCAMDRIMTIAGKYNLKVAEDAAQGVNAFHDGRALGSIGQLGCYSFHETKNYICGEGGALCINDPALVERAEILRDKGTNRKQFFRGQVDKYTWVDVGSSYVPSEICSAFLYAQLEMLDAISARRRPIYEYYREHLEPLASEGRLRLPHVPEECVSNYHMFYILLPDQQSRDALMQHLQQQGILAVFHYVPLHSSPMGRTFGYAEGDLPVTEELSGRLLRLPLYYDITEADQARVVAEIEQFLRARTARPVAAEPAPVLGA